MANEKETEDFSTTVSSLFKGMDTFLTSKTVVGDPIQVGEITIIPLTNVNFGVGAGAAAKGAAGKNSAAGGMGGKMSPSAIIVVKEGRAQIIPVNTTQTTIGKVLDMIPDIVDKVSAKLGHKDPTPEEMEQINEVKDSLKEEEITA